MGQHQGQLGQGQEHMGQDQGHMGQGALQIFEMRRIENQKILIRYNKCLLQINPKLRANTFGRMKIGFQYMFEEMRRYK